MENLLELFGIHHYYSDGWGAYLRRLDPFNRTIGKQNTQKIERQHLTLRTRIQQLARATICFSSAARMYDAALGLFINRFELGRVV